MINANAIGTFFQRKKGKGRGPLPPIPGLDGVIGLYIAKGLANDSMKENPVWKDKSGLGNDFQMKNFSWSVGSGCGLYPINMPADLSVDQPFGTLHFTTSTAYSYTVRAGSTDPITIRFKVRGLTNDIYKHFVIRSVSDGTTIDLKRYYEDGIYEYHYEGTGGLFSVVFYNGTGTPANFSDFYVEVIPDYQGAIVFDGVDDYGVCDTFPILTKEKGYTVMALRKWLTPDSKMNNEIFISNLRNLNWDTANFGAFICEVKYNNNTPKAAKTISFGKESNINLNENNPLFYQTINSYNEDKIGIGDKEWGKFLFVGCGGNLFFANVAIYSICIIDHNTIEEERELVINKWKQDYPELFFDQAWTVTGKTNDDEDRATVKNLTGNGNDLVLSNFEFAEGSGYGLYKYDFKTFNYMGPSIQSTKYPDKFVINKVNRSQVNVNISSSQFKCKVKVSGLSESISLGEVSSLIFYEPTNMSNRTELSSDGIYDIDISSPSNIYLFVVGPKGTIDNPTVLQSPVIIEQIPDYEGYLVTDGVDDRILSRFFDLGKDFTVIGEWKFLDNIKVGAGIVKAYSLFVYNLNNGLRIRINSQGEYPELNTKSLKAFCSDGRVYSDDWSETLIDEEQTVTSSAGALMIAHNGSAFAKFALKNLAFYNRVLSKKECIEAYNYLQTLKAK